MKKIFVLATVMLVTGGAIGIAWSQNESPISKLPFSASRTAGNTLYVSGQVPVTPEGDPVTDSVSAQTHQVMRNVETVLNAQGYDFSDVVKVTVYLKSMDDYQEMNTAYASYFDGAYPARECVGGLEIAFGLNIEISCIAYK